MENKFDKICIFAIIIIFGLFILNKINSTDNNEYKVIINKNPIKVCNEEIYITDHSYNNEILIYELIDEIECVCNKNC